MPRDTAPHRRIGTFIVFAIAVILVVFSALRWMRTPSPTQEETAASQSDVGASTESASIERPGKAAPDRPKADREGAEESSPAPQPAAPDEVTKRVEQEMKSIDELFRTLAEIARSQGKEVSASGSSSDATRSGETAQARTSSITIQGTRIVLEPGKKYRIVYQTGNPNPRPLTPDEHQQVQAIIAALDKEGLRREEHRRLIQELSTYRDISQPLQIREKVVWVPVPGEPEPTEIVTIDLR